MPIFTKQVALDLFGDLWTQMVRETEFGPKIKAENLSILFEYNDPDITMFVDGEGPLFDNDAKDKPVTAIMKMSCDTAHCYWLKKLNVPKAMVMRQIKAEGPAGKIIQLMSLINTVQKIYPGYCKKFGLPTESHCSEMDFHNTDSDNELYGRQSTDG